MRSLSEVLNLFICLILSKINAATSTIYTESGKTLTLNVILQGNPEEILWKYNGNKLAERDLTDFQDYGQFKGRSRIDIASGQLTVRNATRHDSGAYECEIQISGKLQMSKHDVRVIDALQEPIVSCKVNKTTQSTALRCSVPDPQSVTYRWTTAHSDSDQHLGPLLQISTDEEPDSVYTCTVSNPVSRKNTSVTLRACGTDKSALQTILIIIVVITAVIVMIAVIVCLLQRRTGPRIRARTTRKRRTQKTNNTGHVDLEEQAFDNTKKKEKQLINTEDDDDDDDDEGEEDEGSNEHRRNHDKSANKQHVDQAFVDTKKKEKQFIETDDDEDKDDDEDDKGSKEHDKSEHLSPATDSQERQADAEDSKEPENTDAKDTDEAHLAEPSEPTEGATEAGGDADVDANADDGD